MSILSIENHIHLSLISISVAPSTLLALSVLTFVYLYILHVRNNPQPRGETKHTRDHGDHRGAGRPLRRPPFVKRLSARFRTRKQRDRPVAPLWLSFSSLWLPLRHGIRDGGFGFRRQIQSAGMAAGRKRQSQQRLLE